MATDLRDDDVYDAEVAGHQLQQAQQIPTNLALLKMENETIMAAAAVRPRNPMVIVEQLKQLIEAYPAAADEAIYAKPVGKVTRIECGKCKIRYEVPKVTGDTACPTCGSKEKVGGRQVTKFAEGLSIRAAESIRSVFGYTRMATTCEMLDNGDARISGTLVDYAAGNLTSDERIVSRSYKSYSGEVVQTPIDRFINVVVKAEKAKLRRDVILDSTPAIIKALFRDECEKKLKALVSPEQVAQVIVPAFAEFGISAEQLDEIVGHPASMGWREEDRLQLRKILNALKSGETTPSELLDDLANKNGKTAEPKAKRSSVNDVIDTPTPEKPKKSAKQPNLSEGEATPEELAAMDAAKSKGELFQE